ncbi:hypothetical protein ACC703_39680, partial [Rhizobium ruizarguesonis]
QAPERLGTQRIDPGTAIDRSRYQWIESLNGYQIVAVAAVNVDDFCLEAAIRSEHKAKTTISDPVVAVKTGDGNDEFA